MITKIIINNAFGFEKEEIDFSGKTLLDMNSTIEEWDDLEDKVRIIRKVKELFSNEGINISTSTLDLKGNSSKESNLEIQMEWEGEQYKYLMVVYGYEVVMETLLKNQEWIFSRLKDNPDFALNPSYFSKRGKKFYDPSKTCLGGSALFCFKPGEEILKDIRSFLILEDRWMVLNHENFVKEFSSTFPDLSYNKIMNEAIEKYGFSINYDRLEEDNKTLVLANSSVKIGIEFSGSGFISLSRLYPLMMAAKKENLRMVFSGSYDKHLHPVVGNALMAWFLDGNEKPPIGKISHIIL